MEPGVVLSSGMTFGDDFRVVRKLSEGGMGAVWIAEQLSTGKERALKVMHPQMVADPRLRERFAQEARIGARVESDHIVEVVAAGVDAQSGAPWLAMELLKGETLAARLDRGPLDRPAALEMFAQLGHALSAAHDARIVHRDLKPDNLFLATPRRPGVPFTVKVLDFGIAKLVLESHSKHTASIGTPLWMAPEQTEIGKPIVPATDVWAIGLIAYQVLTGRHYWISANTENTGALQLMREVLMDPLEPASARAARYGVAQLLPEGFDEWFSRCVHRSGDARFPHARDAFAALAVVLGRASVGTGTMLVAPTPLAVASDGPGPANLPRTVEMAPRAPVVSTQVMPQPATPQREERTPYAAAASPEPTSVDGTSGIPRGWLYVGGGLALVGGLAFFALSGKKEATDTVTTATTGSPSATAETTTAPTPTATDPAPLPKPTTDDGSALEILDLVVGGGPQAKAGDTLKVAYTGTLADGTAFDTSIGRAPFEFTVGKGDVIKGWDQGLVGMKAGGKRKITMGYALGYGEMGAPPKIPPKSTLVFEIELLAVNGVGAAKGGATNTGGGCASYAGSYTEAMKANDHSCVRTMLLPKMNAGSITSGEAKYLKAACAALADASCAKRAAEKI